MSDNQVGRPTKMDELTVKKLEEAFAFGCTDLEACSYADISKQTLYNYQDKNPGFIDLKERLKEKPVLLARKTVMDKMTDDGKLAMDFLKNKKSDEFNSKKLIEGTMEVKSVNDYLDELKNGEVESFNDL